MVFVDVKPDVSFRGVLHLDLALYNPFRATTGSWCRKQSRFGVGVKMQIAYKLIACRTPEKLLSLSVAAYIPLDKKKHAQGNCRGREGGGCSRVTEK